MGQAILNVLPGFKELELVCAIDSAGHPSIGKTVYKNIKLTGNLVCQSNSPKPIVLVDFSTTDSAITNLKKASSAGVPAVIGVTGFSAEQSSEITAMSRIVPVVISPNMSVGVNVMWKLIEASARVLGDGYKIDIIETHHAHKKDAPSGTAKRMIDIVMNQGVIHAVVSRDPANAVGCGGDRSKNKKKINVKSIREGEVVGNHTIIFMGPYESLEITHKAFSREVFAMGALKAAVWVAGQKPGMYDMGDVLKTLI